MFQYGDEITAILFWKGYKTATSSTFAAGVDRLFLSFKEAAGELLVICVYSELVL